jgi:ketosteroid isomerase-like protein
MRKVWNATVILCAVPFIASAQSVATTARTGVDAFNRAFDQATRNMDNAASVALWENDGVSLLPSTKPIVGKAAIAQFYKDVTSQIPGARMLKFESECFDINISGDLATEWCTEHQIVDIGAGKPPFDGRGKMLLVLHRGPDGVWRLRQEMWNQAVATDSTS